MNNYHHKSYALENKVRIWIHAMRLRTLPLALSGLILGASLAHEQGFFSWTIFVLSLLTGLFLQILSNFANDYGDAQKGSDGKERQGPKRMVSAGLISPKQMKNACIFMIILSLVSAGFLFWESFQTNWIAWGIFLVLLILSIVAAIRYTVGENAYGYKAQGDFYVFIFFGLVTVCGSYALYSAPLLHIPGLPACAAGLLSVAVLNINNIRDMENDERHGKITLALRLGAHDARRYHLALVGGAFCLWVLYFLTMQSPIYLVLMAFSAPLVYSSFVVYKNFDSPTLDKQLKITALGTGFFHIIIAAALALF